MKMTENKKFFINAFVEYDKETGYLTIENSEGKRLAFYKVEAVEKDYIIRELDKMDKRLSLEELCKEFHKTRSIYSACTLADLLYDILYK